MAMDEAYLEECVKSTWSVALHVDFQRGGFKNCVNTAMNITLSKGEV